MSSKLPEATRLAYARQLADEAKTLVPGMERLSAIAEELRADDLYRLLGFDTWERFCADYLGVSKWTANRWIAGSKAKSIGAGQSVAAVQNAPVVESKALNSAKLSGRETAAPFEGVAAALPASSGGAGVQPPAGPTGEAPTSPPPAPPGPHACLFSACITTNLCQADERSDCPLVSAVKVEPDPVDVDAIGLRWLKSKTTREVRAIGDPWGPAIRSEVRRWAEAFGTAPAPADKPKRQQGTISRPADRQASAKPPSNGHPVAGSLTRREVTPMFKP